MTNAHVVAGESETTVEDSGGREYEATVVLFDPNLDLALLRVRELNAPALPLADATPGQTGAAYGHPGGGALDTDARVRSEKTVPTAVNNMYGPGYASRSVLTFLGRIVAGYSGGPLVNGGGDVVGVVFAVSAQLSDGQLRNPGRPSARGHRTGTSRVATERSAAATVSTMSEDGSSIRRASQADAAR